MARILLVEDERELRFSLVHNLEFEGFHVDEAEDGPSGLAKATSERYDLVILDIMMPGMDGLSVLKKLRAAHNSVSVMMLTAKSSEMDKVTGFGLGADDYLTKPFGLGEFLARVKALLRRTRIESSRGGMRYRFLDCEVDFEKYQLFCAGEEVHFSQKEFLLLKYLIQRPGRALDKADIMDEIWGYQSETNTRTIDTHIAKIRRKLNDQNANRFIQTVPTIGYKFIAEVEPLD